MRLKTNAGPRHLTLAPGGRAPMIGIADAVALAAGLAAQGALSRASRLLDLAARRGLRLVRSPRPVHKRVERQPQRTAGDPGGDRGGPGQVLRIPQRD